MAVDTNEPFLDMIPGTLVWLVAFRLGDRESVYPVQFMGFVGSQPAGIEVVVTNPWTDGYSDYVQDFSCRFRAAYLLRKVCIYDLFLSPEEAFKQVMSNMLHTNFDLPEIAKFFDVGCYTGDSVKNPILRMAEEASAKILAEYKDVLYFTEFLSKGILERVRQSPYGDVEEP